MRRSLLQILALLSLALAAVAVPAVSAQDANVADTRIDVTLVIDNSGSMQQNDPNNMRISAAKMFTALMLEGDQLGIVSMGDRESTKALLSLTSPKEVSYSTLALERTLGVPDDLSNWTYMGEALDLAAQVMENSARYNRQRAIIFLTDGLPTYRSEQEKVEQDQKYDRNIALFQKLGIKVFPIALGDGADPEFLQRTMAEPTSGRVLRAESADQLVDVYASILTTLQDGRYIDTYDIVANTETFLANLNPRQQIRQVNFIFPALGKPATIQRYLVPGMSTSVSTSTLYDPNWAMFVALPEYVPRFNGEWRLALENEREQVPMLAVVKSDLRARLIEPTPSIPDDEGAMRYYPAGRPLVIRAGALNRGNLWEKGTGLFVQMLEPQELPGMTLVDRGGAQDVQPADGQYAGFYEQPLQPGVYTLLVNASPTPTHLLLKKNYTITVEPLPTMQVTLGPERDLEVDEPIQVMVKFALDDQPVTVEGAEIVAAVKDKGQTIATLPLEEVDDGVWIGDYVPDRTGDLSFELTAHVDWNAPDGRGLRRYSDYTSASYRAAQQALVEVNVPPVDDRVDGLSEGIQRTVEFRSFSDKPTTLKLSVAGLPDAAVFPSTLEIGPSESGKRTVTISSPAQLPSGEAQARLLISGEESLQLNTSEIPITFTIRGFMERNSTLLSCLVLLLAMLSLRRVRTWLREYWVQSVELLRYGGR